MKRGKNADLLDPFLQDISIIIEKWKHERGQVIEVSFVFLLISHSAESEDGADDFLPHLNDVVVEVALTSGATKFPTKFTLHTFFLINRILPTLNIKLKKWKPTNFGSIFCSRQEIRDQTYLNSIQTR